MTDIREHGPAVVVPESERPIESLFQPESLKNGSFELAVLTTPEQLDEAGRLRAKVYLDRGYITPEDIDEEGRELDEYDPHSTHFGLYAPDGNGGKELVGYTRLISRKSAGELPIEKDYPNYFVAEGSVEVSRLIVDKDKVTKRQAPLANMTLVRALTIESQRQNAPFVYAVMEDYLINGLDRAGITFTLESEPTFLGKYNSTNYATRIDPRATIDGIWNREMELHPDKRGFLKTSKLPKFAHFFKKAMTDDEYEGVVNYSQLDHNGSAVERNLGFLSPEEQKAISETTVAIAGAGGDGGALAINLARSGVKSFRLADPEVFEPENINRQAGANYRSLGTNKAVAIAREILRINPSADIRVFTDGVTQENIEHFMDGADLVVDESDFTVPHVGVMISRKAREEKLPVLMAFNVGFGAYVTSYTPDGLSLEKQLGIDPNMTLSEIGERADEFSDVTKWLGRLPSYGDINVLKRMANDPEYSAPSVVQGVSIASGVGSTQALLHIFQQKDIDNRRGEPVVAPHALSVDALDGTRKIRFRKAHLLGSYAVMAARNLLNLNPITAESQPDENEDNVEPISDKTEEGVIIYKRAPEEA